MYLADPLLRTLCCRPFVAGPLLQADLPDINGGSPKMHISRVHPLLSFMTRLHTAVGWMGGIFHRLMPEALCAKARAPLNPLCVLVPKLD